MYPAERTADDNLERAFRHVSDAWFPPNEDIYNSIREKLEKEDYSETSELVGDLKKDVSLYLFCIKKLAEMLKETDSTPEEGLKPSKILDDSSIPEIAHILDTPVKKISRHSLAEINVHQSERIKESVLSASTAEQLAESLALNHEDGFSVAILRQLGLTLLAWNYPRVYNRVFKDDSTKLVDMQFQRILGFTPTLLGIRFAREWNLSQSVLDVLSAKRSTNPSEITKFALADTAETWAKICEVGEALARANNPKRYPKALDDWNAARTVISKHLGEQGVNKIYCSAQSYLETYSDVTSDLKVVSFLNQEDETERRIVASRYSSELLASNSDLKWLPEMVQNRLAIWYSKLRPDKVINETVEELLFTILPAVGFRRGAVFMFDPENRLLNPAVVMGRVSKYRRRPIKLSGASAQMDFVASVYPLKTPIQETSVDSDGNPMMAIAGTLGETNPVGVLYLEQGHDGDCIPQFRALRKCLSDSLHLQ